MSESFKRNPEYITNFIKEIFPEEDIKNIYHDMGITSSFSVLFAKESPKNMFLFQLISIDAVLHFINDTLQKSVESNQNIKELKSIFKHALAFLLPRLNNFIHEDATGDQYFFKLVDEKKFKNFIKNKAEEFKDTFDIKNETVH